MNILKKFLLVSAIFVLWAGVLPAQQLNLGDVIVRSAWGVEEALPQGTMVAVLNFVSPSATFTDYVIEELTGELVTGNKVAIVDRQNLALISTEMNLQLSGDVSDESAQAIGKMLGAQSIISGTLTDMGRFYRFRIRVINVETARIQTQVSLDLRKDEQVAYLLGDSQKSASRQRPARSSQSDKAANARNNWISGETGYSLGIGVRYERMLSSKISLGADAYFSFFFFVPCPWFQWPWFQYRCLLSLVSVGQDILYRNRIGF
jgi:TolB-like protein